MKKPNLIRYYLILNVISIVAEITNILYCNLFLNKAYKSIPIFILINYIYGFYVFTLLFVKTYKKYGITILVLAFLREFYQNFSNSSTFFYIDSILCLVILLYIFVNDFKFMIAENTVIMLLNLEKTYNSKFKQFINIPTSKSNILQMKINPIEINTKNKNYTIENFFIVNNQMHVSDNKYLYPVKIRENGFIFYDQTVNKYITYIN